MLRKAEKKMFNRFSTMGKTHVAEGMSCEKWMERESEWECNNGLSNIGIACVARHTQDRQKRKKKKEKLKERDETKI